MDYKFPDYGAISPKDSVRRIRSDIALGIQGILPERSCDDDVPFGS
jgi:hypothetical protein